MHRESKCEHDIAEQETAVAEHMCPLCLYAKLEAVRGLQRYDYPDGYGWMTPSSSGDWVMYGELEALLK